MDTFSAHFKQRLEKITQLTTNTISPSLSFECLLDAFLAIYGDCKGLTNQSEHVINFLQKYDGILSQVNMLRVNTFDFDIVQTLATGAVGKVCLVREKSTKRVYAMKILKKMDLLTRREAAFFMEERNALVFAQSSKWMTTLYSAFQDEENLYLVMEYASGGSLRALRNNRDVINENEARFYIGEILIALQELHDMNYIHRDVKPENCLIDSTGHIKLADFGSCMSIGDEKRITSGETVGTPDYISPEILRANEGNVSYGQGCDWWSLGIILYELLFDEVPFYSESLAETYGKIMDHEKHFAFPADCEASAAVLDLMKKLICKQSIRIGSNGAHEIKEHEWFAGFPWDKIRECICILTIAKPPFIPELSGPEDTRYFEDEENESKKLNQKTVKKTKDYSGQGLPFVGYTYLQNLTPVVSLNGAAPTASVSTISTSSSSADKKRIEDLENQIKQLSKATTSDSLKADLETTSKRLESELLIKLQLEEQVAKFNTERIEAQSKIQQLKFEKENDLQERKELVAKVSELSNSLDKEIQSNHGLQDLNESKIKLEKLNMKLKADVESERATALLNIEMAAELGRAKALAELELEQIQRQLHSEQAAAASTKEANQILERKLQDQVQKSSQVEVEKSFLVQRETEFQAKLDSIELLLLDSTTKLDATNSLLLSVEREKALVSAELREASITLAELQLEKDELSISLSEKAKNGVQGSTEADNLRNELTLLEKKRADELTYNSKQRALIEFEFGEVSKKLASELAITKDLKAKLSATEKKVSDLEQSIQALSSTNQSFLLAATHHTAELNSIQLQLRETRSTLNITYLKSGSLEKANMMMTNEIEELKLKISKQISVNGDQEVKIKELETLLEMETKNRNLSEMNFKTSQAAKDALQLDLTRSLARINALKEEQTKYFQDLQAFENREMVLKAEISDLNAKNEQNHLIYDDDCKNFNSERESFNLRLAKIASQLEDSETLCKSLTRQLDKIQEFEGKQILKDSDSNSPSANKRFSKSASLEHFKSDSSSIKSSNTFASSLKPDSGSTKGLGSMVKGLKLKTFFKSSSSRDELTTTKHHSKIPEHYVSNDEVVFDSNSPRKLSASDSNSLMSAGKINKHISQVSVNSSHVDFRLLEYDFAEGLKGWIKVPKQGGKIKKGWKRVYALVKDYKIYIYEKEVSTDDANSKYIEVFDLRTHIIYVRAVTQAELIHASSKDIDSIFKLHLIKESSPTVVELKQPKEKKDVGGIGRQMSMRISPRKTTLLNNSPYVQDSEPEPPMPVPLYKVHAQKAGFGSKDNVSQPPGQGVDTNKRITQLQAYISIEEKYAQGAQSIINASTTEAQRVMAAQQLENFKANIREWNVELVKLVAQNHMMQPQIDDDLKRKSIVGMSNAIFEQDNLDWRNQLEQSIIKKMSEKESIAKLVKVSNLNNIGKVKESTSKDSENQLAVLDKEISKIREDLDCLKSGDMPKIELLLKSLNEKAALSACNGHYFKKRVLNKPQDCGQCREALWVASDGVKTVMECEVCRATCHNYCKLNFDISCQDYTKLKDVLPNYFMALDSFDRNRWIAGIDHYIKEWEKQNYSLPSTPISSTPHSPANKSYRITNSRLLSIQTTPVTVQGTFHMNEIAPSPIANLNDSVPPSIRSKDNLITEEVGGEMGVQPIIESRSRTSTNQAM